MSVHSSIDRETANRQHDPWAPGEGVGVPARELAQRRSGTDEVLLLWHPDTGQVELFVRDTDTGVGFHLDVAPECAIDAFNHPYAYVARRENAGRLAPTLAVSLDG